MNEKMTVANLASIKELMADLVVLKSYELGLISKEEAYKRTGIKSELRENSREKVVDLGKFEHG